MEAHLSRPRIALMLGGSLLLVVFGLWLVGAFGEVPPSVRHSDVMTALVGWATVACAGAGVIVFLRRILQSGAEIRIDADGIYWRGWSDQVIGWSAIHTIAASRKGHQRFLALYLHDPAAFPSRSLSGRLARMTKYTGGDIVVSTGGCDRSLDDIAAAVRYFAPGLMR